MVQTKSCIWNVKFELIVHYLSCFIEKQHLTDLWCVTLNTNKWKHLIQSNLPCGISCSKAAAVPQGIQIPVIAALQWLHIPSSIKSPTTSHLCSRRNFLPHGVSESWNLTDTLRAALTNYYYCISICHFVTALRWHQGTGATSSQNSVSGCDWQLVLVALENLEPCTDPFEKGRISLHEQFLPQCLWEMPE